MKNKLSIIIPFRGCINKLNILLNSISKQTFLPNEIIIVNTNKDKNCKINKNFSKLNCKVFNYYNLYPGAARNIGVKKANNEIVCFLDIKTIPGNSNWLEDLFTIYIKSKIDIVFGSTTYKYNNQNLIKKIVLSCSFGNINHETVPGSITSKSIFNKYGYFYENVRSGEDYEWRKRLIKKKCSIKVNYKNPLLYQDLDSNIIKLSYKYFLYSYHSSKLDILADQKIFFMSIILILSSLLIPRWNFYIDGWDNNYLYVPNITKIFIITLFFFSLNYFLYSFLFKLNFKFNLFNKLLIFTLFIYFTYCVYNYNYFIIDRFDYASLYFPHVTKVYIFCLLLAAIFFRGFYLPLKRKINKSFIYKNFLIIGIVGIILDLSKIPGNIIGFFLLPFTMMKLKFPYDRKKILFICPFPFGVQAGQRLKYEQFFDKFEQNGYDIEVASFINMNTWKIIYKKGYFFRKSLSLLIGYLKRILKIFSLNKYDTVYVFMWVTPYGFNFFEKIYRMLSNKIIYDIEDNILIIKKNKINPLNSFFKTQYKIRYLIKSSDKVIASSADLAKECNKIANEKKTTYICASINISRYIPINKYSNDNLINIGWTGTFTSKIYLDILRDFFQKLSLKFNFRLLIISDFDYDLPGVNVKVIKWKKETEIKDLSNIDIGVYPLPYDDWVSGKSGLKALQYMAMGLPTVASNVGNIKNVIKDGYDGFLVNNINEWENRIIELLNNNFLRKKIGLNARKTVVDNFSIDSNTEKYLNVLKK